MSSSPDAVSFRADIKPLFRELDRESMQSHFDLWDHDDVSKNAAAILERLRDGSMPCDGAWPADRIDLFDRWIESGTQE
jgi:hypothetical protein